VSTVWFAVHVAVVGPGLHGPVAPVVLRYHWYVTPLPGVEFCRLTT
jgi:hypothetical protein